MDRMAEIEWRAGFMGWIVWIWSSLSKLESL